jgi:hypothetical protein
MIARGKTEGVVERDKCIRVTKFELVMELAGNTVMLLKGG